MMKHFSLRLRAFYTTLLLIVPLIAVDGCGESEAEKLAKRQREAIKRVLEMDKAYAQVRNQNGSKTDFDKLAAAAKTYTESLAATDMSELPQDVREAYAQHARAWQDMVIFLNEYTGLTGSFRRGWDGDAAKFRFEAYDKAIKDSWDGVKARAAAHGVDMSAYN